jgi:hypothetical protein
MRLLKERLARKEFIIAIAVSIVIYLGLFYLCKILWTSIFSFDVWYLFAQSLIELLLWIAVALISISRLRDMEWPVAMATIYIPIWLFGSRNLVVYDALLNESKGLEGEWLLWVPAISIGILFFFGIFLLTIPSTTDHEHNRG